MPNRGGGPRGGGGGPEQPAGEPEDAGVVREGVERGRVLHQLGRPPEAALLARAGARQHGRHLGRRQRPVLHLGFGRMAAS
jgi:hypothetical protein